MKHVDKEILGEMYVSMYEDTLDEGIGKNIMMGAAALGLGYGGLQGVSHNIVNKDQAQKEYASQTGHHMDNPEIDNEFKDVSKIVKLLKQYSPGSNISYQGDEYIIKTPNGKTHTVSSRSLKSLVDMARSGQTNSKLGKFLNDNL